MLKDADATAIYSSREANGAINVITKKGKAGKRKIGPGIQIGSTRMDRFPGYDEYNTILGNAEAGVIQ